MAGVHRKMNKTLFYQDRCELDYKILKFLRDHHRKLPNTSWTKLLGRFLLFHKTREQYLFIILWIVVLWQMPLSFILDKTKCVFVLRWIIFKTIMISATRRSVHSDHAKFDRVDALSNEMFCIKPPPSNLFVDILNCQCIVTPRNLGWRT